MGRLRDSLLALIATTPGLTDRELTNRLLGPSAPQQSVNQAARGLASAGLVERRIRHDDRIGNYPSSADSPADSALRMVETVNRPDESASLSEDDVKHRLKAWLETDGWMVKVKWGIERGIDVEATRDGERWVIEAKGCGSSDQMRGNYFIAMLGETLQRMSDDDARYSIAMPDMRRFRRLWSRLPRLARQRTQITALFVARDGAVDQVP